MSHFLKEQISELIGRDELLVGQTYRAILAGTNDPKALVEAGLGANVGVVSNNKAIIRSILENQVPASSNIARYTFRTINRLRAQGSSISPELEDYLASLQQKLDIVAKSSEAALHDAEEAAKGSASLAEKWGSTTEGVYVYSFPTYLKHGTDEDPELKWLKIGSTKNTIWRRIVDQSRQTSMPEDPVLLRIYQSNALSVEQLEFKFHYTLDKIGHSRSSAKATKAGKEWFATTIEALDALAELMNLDIGREGNY
jgi:hypothetical protein